MIRNAPGERLSDAVDGVGVNGGRQQIELSSGTQTAPVAHAGEAPHEIDAADAEPAEKFVVGRHVNVEAIFAGRRAQRRPAAIFKFVAIQRICRISKIF